MPCSTPTTTTFQVPAYVAPAANMVITNVSIPSVSPGQAAKATVTITNNGGQLGSASISGVTVQNGVQQGTWIAQNFVVGPGQTQTVTMYSAGAISDEFAGQTLEAIFSLSTGYQSQPYSFNVNTIPVTITPQVILTNQPSQYGSVPLGVGIWSTQLACGESGNFGQTPQVGFWTIQPNQTQTINLPKFGQFLIRVNAPEDLHLYPVNSGFAVCPGQPPTKLNIGLDEYSPYV